MKRIRVKDINLGKETDVPIRRADLRVVTMILKNNKLEDSFKLNSIYSQIFEVEWPLAKIYIELRKLLAK